MGKYDPLRDYLQTQSAKLKKIILDIDEIQEIIKAPLPITAWNEGVFWANNRIRQSPQSAAWLNAGWTATERIGDRQVIFRRIVEKS